MLRVGLTQRPPAEAEAVEDVSRCFVEKEKAKRYLGLDLSQSELPQTWERRFLPPFPTGRSASRTTPARKSRH